MKYTFTLVIPLANEPKTFHLFIRRVQDVLDLLEMGVVWHSWNNIFKKKGVTDGE